MNRELIRELSRVRGFVACGALRKALEEMEPEAARQLLVLLRHMQEEAREEAERTARRRFFSGRFPSSCT